MESFNVRPEDVKRFVSDSLVKVGATVGNAKTVADVLTAADLRGHYSHGLNRLGSLSLRCVIQCSPSFES